MWTIQHSFGGAVPAEPQCGVAFHHPAGPSGAAPLLHMGQG